MTDVPGAGSFAAEVVLIPIDKRGKLVYIEYTTLYNRDTPPTRLILLGLLQRRNLHGYEIKRVIEEHMGDWASIAFGSIYFALAKLAKEGLVRRVSVGKEGNRPSRTVYGITNEGRKEFRRMLEDLWRSPQRQFFAFDVALFFSSSLPSKNIMRYLEQRIEHTQEAFRQLGRHKAERLADPEVPRIARGIFNHALVHLEAEMHWLRALRDDLAKAGRKK
jgi:DNA-binding PadR family transcriptional regulator